MTTAQPTDQGVDEVVVRPRAAPRGLRMRLLVVAALGPLVLGFLAAASVSAVVLGSAPLAVFSVPEVLASARWLWLAAYQVPVTLRGAPLGVLPLLLTLVAALLVARSARASARRMRLRTPGPTQQLIGTIAAAHGVFAAVLAAVQPEGAAVATPTTAFVGAALVSGVAATIALAETCGLAELIGGLEVPIRRGLYVGVLGVVALLAVGALLFSVGLLVALPRVAGMFMDTGQGIAEFFGIALLCLAYLPNIVVAGTSFALGSGFAVGKAVIAPIGMALAPVPSVPLLAALPPVASRWWLAVFVLPLLVGVLVGWCCRTCSPEPVERVKAVAVAAALIGLALFALAFLAGGRLGGGPFDPVTVQAGKIVLAAAGWVLVPGALVAWVFAPKPSAEPEAEEADQESDETDAEDTVLEEAVLDEGAEDAEEAEPAEETEDETAPEEDVAEAAEQPEVPEVSEVDVDDFEDFEDYEEAEGEGYRFEPLPEQFEDEDDRLARELAEELGEELTIDDDEDPEPPAKRP
ncbi:DUF6350 family protein [Allokutzneria sp. A3M-2-11 16]|uniref:cell division protein PerM n=1 Tax=Allokutzneria sp. A3M-2-11 16 TaxID=2962043 RepID=UPI0020B8CF05|nr:DUF6350 family protein [Allokutzneria sp. A3M-2-11 16]MCP3798781.1 DUF6350 family protein [Allokutzneria sp. A3M-2-11 16]